MIWFGCISTLEGPLDHNLQENILHVSTSERHLDDLN